MRQLTKQEKEFTIKGIERLKKRNEYLEYLKEYDNLMLDLGLEENFKKQLAEYKDVLGKATTEFQKRYNQLMIDKGLKINHNKKFRDFADDLKQIEEETSKNEYSIKEMTKHLKYGVEEKKKKDQEYTKWKGG